MSTMDQIRERISEIKPGEAFTVSDFLDIADHEMAKKALSRLEKSGEIRRVMRGVYDKPQYSQLLNEYAAPSPTEIARAIARNNNWTIAPAGDTALNLLGLSTQVPSDWQFISSGPYKNYTIGNISIHFLHRADRDISGMSYITGLVIGALKTIGRENVTEKDLLQIKSCLTEKDKETILLEGKKASIWIYSMIKKICREEW